MGRDYNKPKFDKRKCARCKYKGMGTGYSLSNTRKARLYHCAYMLETGIPVLRKKSTWETYDIRGDDYYNCQLFEEEVKGEQEQIQDCLAYPPICQERIDGLQEEQEDV